VPALCSAASISDANWQIRSVCVEQILIRWGRGLARLSGYHAVLAIKTCARLRRARKRAEARS